MKVTFRAWKTPSEQESDPRFNQRIEVVDAFGQCIKLMFGREGAQIAVEGRIYAIFLKGFFGFIKDEEAIKLVFLCARENHVKFASLLCGWRTTVAFLSNY